MAFGNVRNATVTRVFHNGTGAEVTETFQTRSGEEGSKKYTAWFDEPHGLDVGTVGNFSGLLGVKARIWTPEDGEPRALADIVLNSARFEAVDSGDSGPF